jgi:hypothetical protein
MNIIYIYSSMILFVLILICVVACNLKFVPNKIRDLSVFSLSLIFLRYITLLLMIYRKNILYSYLAYPFYFLNLLYIPIIILLCLFIFTRNDKIKLHNAYLVCPIVSVIYIIILYKLNYKIVSFGQLGYKMIIEDNHLISYIFIVVSIIIVLLCVMNLSRKVVNNIGLFLLTISLLSQIGDNIISLLNISCIPENILNEIFFIIALKYALGTFKNKNSFRNFIE